MTRRKKAILFGIDGCRPDALSAARTPCMDALIRSGSFSDMAQTGRHTISAPGWTDMLTGVWYEKHGVRDNSFDGMRLDRYPHFFTRIKEKRPDLVTGSIVHWEPINGVILSGSDVRESYPSDAEVAVAAARCARESDPDILFLQFDEVDAAGHRHGYAPDSAGYVAAIEKVDSEIAAVLDVIDGRPGRSNEEWLVVVSTDHGGSEQGHGRDVPEHRTVFLIVAGDAVQRGTIEPAPGVVVVPPTIAAHFGIAVDPIWEWEGAAVGLPRT